MEARRQRRKVCQSAGQPKMQYYLVEVIIAIDVFLPNFLNRETFCFQCRVYPTFPSRVSLGTADEDTPKRQV